MKVLGLDIGTTSISAVVYDTADRILAVTSAKNDSFLPGDVYERIQDPHSIRETAFTLVNSLLNSHPDVSAMGVTGQMHGIVYLDVNGEPVSPLYTWQDGSAGLPFDDRSSWASHLSDLTGFPVSSGYGMATYYYHLHQGLVPKNAAVICTIQDYLAMKFAGRTRPVMDPTNAASLGLFDVAAGQFSAAALEAAGIDPQLLPQITADPYLGTGTLGIPVFTAIGDNQASYLGATGGRTDVILVNMGTGGQISVYSPNYLQTETLETRPFPDGGWLLVGASLCGGRSYALLEKFFRETVKMVTGEETDAYSAMDRLMNSSGAVDNCPTAITTFQGTRKDPSLRGAFLNISEDNFTPAHFIYGVMRGMAEELFSLYQSYLASGSALPAAMIGSGNALRKNRHLCRFFEETFSCKMILSEKDEEAACGAAIYAANHMQ